MKVKFIYSVISSALLALSLIFVSAPVFAATPASTVQLGTPATTTQPDITVKSLQGPSVSQRLNTRAQQAWPWYITRAAGIIAVVLLALLILSGIGLITGYTFRLLEPLNAWAVHKAIGYAFGACVIIHVVALLFDHYVPFSLTQVLVPFAATYRPAIIFGYHLGTLYVAFGVIALYILAIIIGTSIWLMDKKPRLWKMIHLLSYLVLVLVYFHVLYLGTDVSHGVFRAIWIVIGYATAIASLYRLKRARSI